MKKIILSFILASAAFTLKAQVRFVSSVYANQAGESAVSHNGKFLYLSGLHEITVYEINQSKGGLTQKSVLNSPYNEEFTDIELSPDDKYLYTRSSTRRGSNLVGVLMTYSCNPQTGELKFVRSQEQQGNTTFDLLSGIKLSPKGNFLFITVNSATELIVFKRNSSDGSLTFLYQTPASTSQFGSFTISPDEKFLYVSPMDRTYYSEVYSIDQSTGTLSRIETQTPHDHQNDYCSRSAISADGKHVYFVGDAFNPSSVTWSADITQYSRNEQTGMLTFQKHYTNLSGQGISDLDYLFSDGSGDYIYACKAFGADVHEVHVFKRDPSTGNLTKEQSFYDNGITNKLKGSYRIVFGKDNRFAYVSSCRDNALNIFENPKARPSVNNSSVSTAAGSFPQDDDDDVSVSTGNSGSSSASGGNTSGTSNSGSGMPKDKFNEAWKKIQAETSDTKRLDLCYELLEGKSISTIQTAALAMLFSSEYKRLEFVKFASYFVSDKNNFALLRDLFTYDTLLEDFNKLVK